MYRRKLTAPHTTQVHDEVFGGLIASCKGDTTWLLAGAILFAVLGFFCILAGVQGQIAGAGSYLLIMLGIVFFAAAVFALLCMKDRIDFYEYGIFVINRKGIEKKIAYDEIKSIQLKKRIIVARNHSRTVYNWHIIGQDDTELQLIPNDDYRNISQYLTMAGDAFHLLEVADNRRKTILKP